MNDDPFTKMIGSTTREHPTPDEVDAVTRRHLERAADRRGRRWFVSSTTLAARASIGVAVTAAVAIATVGIIRGADAGEDGGPRIVSGAPASTGDTSRPATPAAPPSRDESLDAAVERIAALPDDVALTAGTYWWTRSESRYRMIIVNAEAEPAPGTAAGEGTTSTEPAGERKLEPRESWFGFDGDGQIQQMGETIPLGSNVFVEGGGEDESPHGVEFTVGPMRFDSYAELEELPTDESGFAERLAKAAKDIRGDGGSSGAEALFGSFTESNMAEMPLRPAIRAATLRAMSQIPEVEVAVDPDTGTITLTRAKPTIGETQSLVFDALTGWVIEERSTLDDGTLGGEAFYRDRGRVNRAGVRP